MLIEKLGRASAATLARSVSEMGKNILQCWNILSPEWPEKNWAGLPLMHWPEASHKWKKVLQCWNSPKWPENIGQGFHWSHCSVMFCSVLCCSDLFSPKLPAKAAIQSCQPHLLATFVGHSCQPKLPAKVASQSCRPKLPAKVAGHKETKETLFCNCLAYCYSQDRNIKKKKFKKSFCFVFTWRRSVSK